MYGEGFGPEGDDDCCRSRRLRRQLRVPHQRRDAGDRRRRSRSGTVPKYVAVTPDGKYVLMTNWCSYDLSVDPTPRPARRSSGIPMGPYPRGIVVSPDSTTAYVAVMGTHDIAKVDLTNFDVELDPRRRPRTAPPRHLTRRDVAVRDAERRRAGGEDRPGQRRGAVTRSRPGEQPREHGDLDRRPVALRRELRVERREQAGHERPARGADASQTGYHPIGITYDRTTGASGSPTTAAASRSSAPPEPRWIAGRQPRLTLVVFISMKGSPRQSGRNSACVAFRKVAILPSRRMNCVSTPAGVMRLTHWSAMLVNQQLPVGT